VDTKAIDAILARVVFDDAGLVTAVAHCTRTRRVLMVAWMNAASLRLTLETGQVWYWSRSRQELWRKGATSSHTQTLKELLLDCDGDTLLLNVEQQGVACHTGAETCFFQPVYPF
jgi:phosphoribosyl-AMP cyclohydrolase